MGRRCRWIHSGIGAWNEGDFRVDDVEPVHVDPDGNVDFDGSPVEVTLMKC